MRKLFISLCAFICAASVLAQQQINIKLTGETEPRSFFISDIESIYFDVHYDDPSLIGLEPVDLGLPSGVKWANIDYYQEENGNKVDRFPWIKQMDVVSSDWGSRYPDPWRMPTKADFQELLDYCTWTYDSERVGFVVTSKDESITEELFLPCNTVDENLNIGYYWLSDAVSTAETGWHFWFYHVTSTVEEKDFKDDKAFSVTMAIRPVFGKAIPPKVVGMNAVATPSGDGANVLVTYSGDYADVVNYGLLKADTQAELDGLVGDDDENPNNGSPGSSHTFTLSNLEPGTYYVKPYVFVGKGYQYGNTVSFTIADVPVNKKFPVPAAGVDLGLPSGVLWSPYNFGYANENDTISHFYGWGDPTGELKSNNSGVYADGKWLEDISAGEYDVARSQWGGEWRLPRKADWEELYKYCDFVAGEKNGMVGYFVKNRKGVPDNSIFIALCGVSSIKAIADGDGNIVFKETPTELRNSQGFYWTSETDDSGRPYRLRVQATLSDDNFEVKTRATRGSIRPVYGPVQGGSTPGDEPGPGDVTDEDQSLEKDPDRSNDITAVPKEGVDLGLPSGAKWAAWNVGAQGVDDLGRYYAWGETEDKSTYTFTDYTSDLKDLEVEDIDMQHDVARQLWGDNWRMPTYNDYDELFSMAPDQNGKDSLLYVTTEWTMEGNCFGLKVTSRKNPDKYIFFPAGGHKTNSEVDVNRYGRYWTGSGSTVSGKKSTHATHLLLGEELDGDKYFQFNSLERFIGCLVRPIFWISVTDIQNNMSSTELTMKKGATLALDYSVLPANATNKEVAFVIGNQNVVSRVGTTDRIRAREKGTTSLRVVTLDGEKILTYTVTVTE